MKPVEAPVTHGTTVWGAAPTGLIVAEQPNWFGRLERFQVSESEPGIVLVAPGAPAPHQMWVVTDDALVMSPGDPRPPIGDIDRIAALARRLARRLSQSRGVRLAHGEPQWSWFVVLTPVAAARVVESTPTHPGVTAEPIGPRFPDLPGGLRIAVAEPGGRDVVEEYGDRFTEAVAELWKETAGG